MLVQPNLTSIARHTNSDGGPTCCIDVSDNGFTFRQLNDGRPVLGPPPKGNFGTAGRGANHSVHASQMIVVNGRVRTWYGGEDALPPHHQKIGLMEAKLVR